MIDTNFERRLTEMPNYSAQDRWRADNLKRYTFSLRIDTDQELIDFIAKSKDSANISEIVREALQLLVDSKSHIGK